MTPIPTPSIHLTEVLTALFNAGCPAEDLDLRFSPGPAIYVGPTRQSLAGTPIYAAVVRFDPLRVTLDDADAVSPHPAWFPTSTTDVVAAVLEAIWWFDPTVSEDVPTPQTTILIMARAIAQRWSAVTPDSSDSDSDSDGPDSEILHNVTTSPLSTREMIRLGLEVLNLPPFPDAEITHFTNRLHLSRLQGESYMVLAADLIEMVS